MKNMILATLIIALAGPIALEAATREILCRIYAWRHAAWKNCSRKDAIIARKECRLQWKKAHKCL